MTLPFNVFKIAGYRPGKWFPTSDNCLIFGNGSRRKNAFIERVLPLRGVILLPVMAKESTGAPPNKLNIFLIVGKSV